jgi:hypothetical protein
VDEPYDDDTESTFDDTESTDGTSTSTSVDGAEGLAAPRAGDGSVAAQVASLVRTKVAHSCRILGSRRIARCVGGSPDALGDSIEASCADPRSPKDEESADSADEFSDFSVNWRVHSAVPKAEDECLCEDSPELELEFEELEFELELQLRGVELTEELRSELELSPFTSGAA